MSVTSGYGRTNLSGTVSLNVDKSQGRLQANASRLSSGLRINNASDDPSGLAISETLKSKVNGFDQAVSNVQDATNAATVAEGALQTTTDILQRVRTLAVEAANDVLSKSDRTNVQTEISELLHEVDQISQNTNFNGLPLLDGTYSGSTPQQPATVSVVSNAVLALATVVLPPPTPNLIADPTFSTPGIAVGSVASGIGSSLVEGSWTYSNTAGVYRDNGNVSGVVRGVPSPPPPGGGQAAFMGGSDTPSLTTQVNLIAGKTYTLTVVAEGTSGLDYIDMGIAASNFVFQTTQAGFGTYTTTLTPTTSGAQSLGISWLSFANVAADVGFISDVSVTEDGLVPTILSGLLVASAVAANTNFATTAGGISGLGGTGTGDGSIELQVINTGASIAAQETFIDSATGAISVSPTLLAPNSTSTLFDNVAISTGNFSTPDVGVTSYVKVSQNVPPSIGVNPALSVHSGADEGNIVNVQLPAVSSSALRLSNVNVVSSYDGNPSLAAEDAIGQIDHALSSLLTQRAQLGAFMVRLSVEASNDNVAGVNLQAAESNIRDANVAQETTAYTSDQILIAVGTSVLAQSATYGKEVESLFQ